MSGLDYVIVVVFSLIVFGSGMAFSRSGASIKSFFAAGGEVPWWLNGLSLFMSFFSAGTFVVWGSIAYEHGWVAITIQWMMGLGGFIIAFFIAPRWKRFNVLTAAEFVTKRFGVSAQKFYSYIFLFLSITYTGAFLYPIAKLVNVSTGLPIIGSILVLGVIIIIYTAVGGLWAVIITDVLQFIILTAGVLIVVPLAFDNIGGIAPFFNEAPEGFFNLISEEYSLGFLIAFAVYNGVFIGGNWAYVQRYTSVKDEKASQKVGLLFSVLYVFAPIFWMLPPMIFRIMNPDLGGLENEGAYLLVCKEVLPKGLLGLMLGGMVFATASSVNTTLNTSAAVFTNDIYKRLFSQVTMAKLVWVGRIATAVFGVLTIGFAMIVPSLGGIVEVVLSVGALTGVPLYGPPVWGLFSKKQTSKSILIVTGVSLLVNAIFKFFGPDFGMELSRSMEMALGVGLPLLLLTLFEFINPHQEVNIVATDAGGETDDSSDDDSQNKYALQVVGVAVFLVGLLVTFLGISSETGKLVTLTIGTLILAVGAIIYKKAKS